MSERRRLHVRGTVQGVGFRPFVYRLATALHLDGVVRNTADGVVIEIQGPPGDLDAFARRLEADRPPLARIEAVAAEALPELPTTGFHIDESRAEGAVAAVAPADVAACAACLAELRDPADRRARYPFINCTDCGPRFTIIEGLPYDRARTTMRGFALCPACRAEYEDPTSRRFHAEPNACPACGPKVRIHGADVPDPIAHAAARLRDGAVVAVKGVGGFHLAVLARDEAAVSLLRRRKRRPREPFALMAPDLDAVRRFARTTPDEEVWLAAPERPIVLLPQRAPFPLAPSIAPGNATVGVMLPYAPLHHLLFDALGDEPLVMTSGNLHGEPIVKDDAEALDRLPGLADVFLLHDRPILARADDSVGIFAGGELRLVRRARGYVPRPLALPLSGPPVLAVGADLKNAFCLTRGASAFLGPHVGDLEDAATAESFGQALAHFAALLDVRPEVIVHDLHPDYVSTRLAERLARETYPGARLLGVQHHHAHILACLAEHGTTGPALGLAIDGTGFGLDGTSWGCEILAVDGLRCERLAHLTPLPIPGGDRAAREPWRIAVALLVWMGRDDLIPWFVARWGDVPEASARAIAQVVRADRMVPRSSSLGRLFDGVSALAGVRTRIDHEGEAAIILEQRAEGLGGGEGAYPLPLLGDAPRQLDARALLCAVVEDLVAGVPVERVSARFHEAVVGGLVEGLRAARAETGLGVVAIGGGAAQNRRLLGGLMERLRAEGFGVLTCSGVPAGDGGIAVGQAVAGLLSR